MKEFDEEKFYKGLVDVIPAKVALFGKDIPYHECCWNCGTPVIGKSLFDDTPWCPQCNKVRSHFLNKVRAFIMGNPQL